MPTGLRRRPWIRRGCTLLAGALLCAPLLTGCGLDSAPADFRFLNPEPETIDPGRVSGQAGGRIASSLFEGLCRRRHPDLVAIPGVAESMENSPDGRRWTFHLRDCRWSDGRPVTSQDFLYSWTRLLDPATGARYANLLFAVRGARDFNAGRTRDPSHLGLSCPDSSTFVVELEHPVPYFLDLCAFYALLPVPRHVVESVGDAWIRPEHIVSNGPFVLADWQIHRRIRMRRNPRYWNAAQVSLEVVDALPGEDANSNFNRYASGGLDWVDSDGVPAALVDLLAKRDDWHSAPYLSTYFYRFNLRRPPFDDPRVRKAFYYATDAASICRNVLRGGQLPAHSLVPPGLPGYEEVHLDGYDPQRARRLLADAGHPGGEGLGEIELLFNTSESHREIAEVLQQQWKEVLGARIVLRNMEWKVFQATVQSGDYQIARGGWIGDYLDPSTFLDIFESTSGNNRTGFASAHYDSLLRAAAATVDPPARMRTLHRMESIVTREQCIILPIYTYVVTNMYDARKWAGLEPTLLNTLHLDQVHRRPQEAR
jgi:oligopeptide transport system substrate-binding protein